jgi:hypothetical protein
MGTRWNCGIPKRSGNTRAPPGRGRDLLEMHDAEHARQDRACDDAQQHRDIGEKAASPFDQAENDQQHEQRDAQPLQLAIARVGEGAGNAIDHLGQGRQAAAGPVDAHPHQRDADHQDDGAGDDGRKQRQQPADERRGKDAEDSSSDHRAIDAEQPDVGRRRHRQHRTNRRKGDAHHDRELNADPGKADTLHQGGQPAGEQIRADQEGHVLRRQLQRPPDDQGDGDRAGIHHQDMLQAQRQQAGGWQDLVDRMDFGAHERLPPSRCGPVRLARLFQANTRPVPSTSRPATGCPMARTLLIAGPNLANSPVEREAYACR